VSICIDGDRVLSGVGIIVDISFFGCGEEVIIPIPIITVIITIAAIRVVFIEDIWIATFFRSWFSSFCEHS